ncbi:MAG TPA: translation initiation factor IF-2 [Tepidisphaeraceae bacterium]
MAKSIRVSQLAKELGIESKVILEKCKEEGLAEKVPAHSSALALGLSETIREWHRAGELDGLIKKFAGTDSSKKKKAPAKMRAESESDSDGGVATLVAEDEAPRVHDDHAAPDDDAGASDDAKPVGRDESAIPDVTVEPVEPIVPAPAVTPPTTPPVPVAQPAPVSPPLPSNMIPPLTPHVPTTPSSQPLPAPVVQPPAPVASAPKAVIPMPPTRPTVKLESRSGPAKPERPRAPAFTPKPAELQGPKLVREEKPDIVSAPRKRVGPGMGPVGPSSMQAPPRGGRGVKVTEGEEGGEKSGVAKPVSARRRGPDGRRGEADEKLREFSEADLKDRADRILAASAARQATDLHLRKTEARGTHVQARTIAERGGALEIEEPITVRSLSAALGVKTNELMGKLMKMGIFAGINQSLEFDTAQLVALQYHVELTIRKQPTLEDQLMAEFDSREVAPENLLPRPAVVTILGHVDHGKTSLLDKIRSASVAAGEAGGITQHIAAWQVNTPNGKRVTFIDTPGHQAFTAMRARGANMTDVVVLVIDAAQGVQPQTTESINHAKAAGVPIVVAMSKIDRPDVNPDMVLGQLAAAGLNPVEWGGDTEIVRTSAVTGQGIPELIETLDYQAELRELRADPTGPARGTVIESRMDPGLGPIATVLVQDGTLDVGDVVLAGRGWGKVRSLLDDNLKQVPSAGPSTPIIISGMSELPLAGDKFFEVDSADRAREITQERVDAGRAQQAADKNKVSLESIYGQMKDSVIKTINLIIKADVQGSVETLQKTVTDQNTAEVRVKVIHAAAGPISESDVELADASNAVIIGFHVVPDESARAMAEQRRIEIRTYRVIYEIFDDLKKALSGMLEPEVREKLHGHVEVRAVFKVSRMGNIAGCFVTDGHIQRGSKIRLTRDGKIITEDLTIESLKRVKEDAREVKAGFECGIKLANYDDIKIGDILEAYIRETIQRTL